jgi:hypothetical protein
MGVRVRETFDSEVKFTGKTKEIFSWLSFAPRPLSYRKLLSVSDMAL